MAEMGIQASESLQSIEISLKAKFKRAHDDRNYGYGLLARVAYIEWSGAIQIGQLAYLIPAYLVLSTCITHILTVTC